MRSRLGRVLVVVLAEGGLAAIPGAPAPAGSAVQDTCVGLPATIVDLNEGARVVGTDGDDVILVGAAASVHAGNGDDEICGTGRIYGEGGDDAITLRVPHQLGDVDPLFTKAFGGSGHDDIVAGQHVDYLYGGPGDDYLAGARNNDVLVGGSALDYVLGGDGDDRLWGGRGPDLLAGHRGQDKLFGSEADDYLYGGDGADIARGEAGNDEIDGQKGVDRARGGSGQDWCRSETIISCELDGPL
jgi:Ca2+-binding RTX toxin-like protein